MRILTICIFLAALIEFALPKKLLVENLSNSFESFFTSEAYINFDFFYDKNQPYK